MNLFSQLFRRPPGERGPRCARPALEHLEERLQPSSSPISLGAAAGFAVLGLQHTEIDNRNVTVTGNEGVSKGGELHNSFLSTVTGDVDQASRGQYHGHGH